MGALTEVFLVGDITPLPSIVLDHLISHALESDVGTRGGLGDSEQQRADGQQDSGRRRPHDAERILGLVACFKVTWSGSATGRSHAPTRGSTRKRIELVVIRDG